MTPIQLGFSKLKDMKTKNIGTTILILFLVVYSQVLFAQGPPPPPTPPASSVPFDDGIGFFVGAVLLWAGKKRFFDKK
jgi:hypothetical protein